MIKTKRIGQKRAIAMLLAIALVVTGCFVGMGPTVAMADGDPQAVLTVYDHNDVKGTFTIADLNVIAANEGSKTYNYAGYNTVPTWNTVVGAQGPTVKGIMQAAGVNMDTLAGNTRITFTASDGYSVYMTKDQLLATRYYYPNGNIGTISGALGGLEALAGKVETPVIINLLSEDNGTLSLGQKLPNEQTWPDFNKYMAMFNSGKGATGKIIIGDVAPTWTPVTVAGTKSETGVTSIATGSSVAVGTVIGFVRSNLTPKNKINKSAKIYYTLDGTDPTMASTFYNYAEYDGDKLTNSILLNQPGHVTIKTIVIGLGGLDSAISTFTYHVVPKAPSGLTSMVVSSNSTRLNWEASEGATGYNVYRGLTANTVTELVAKGLSATTYTDTNLSTNTTYYYQVAAAYDDYEGTKTAYVMETPSVDTSDSSQTNLLLLLAFGSMAGAILATRRRRQGNN